MNTSFAETGLLEYPYERLTRPPTEIPYAAADATGGQLRIAEAYAVHH